MKVYTVNVQNRPVAVALGLAMLLIVIAVLIAGAALLAGVAIAAGVVGTGVGIYRRLRGDRGSVAARTAPAGAVGRVLDPALEVFPDRPALGGRRDGPVE